MIDQTRLEKAIEDFQVRNFDRRYIGASISKLEVPMWATQKIASFMEKPKNFLVFLSKPGIGKTYMCAGLIEWALPKFHSVRYHREYNLLTRLRQGISEGEGDYLKALEFLADDDLVFLDDVGSGINPSRDKHRELEWRKEVFFSFLDQRYNSMKPTIITSNFSMKDFENIYSERVSSRLFAEENTVIQIFDDSIVDKRLLGM